MFDCGDQELTNRLADKLEECARNFEEEMKASFDIITFGED